MEECYGCKRKEDEIVRLETEVDRARRDHSRYRREVEGKNEHTDVEVAEIYRLGNAAEARATETQRKLTDALVKVGEYERREERVIATEKRRSDTVREVVAQSADRDAQLVEWHGLGRRCVHLFLRWTSSKGDESRGVMVRATADIVDELEKIENAS